MFISFEGIEGAGKSTVIAMLASYMENLGQAPVITREPGGSSLGRLLRSVLLDSRSRDLSDNAELFMFLADRSQHIREVILPALDAGQTVICDRFADSTFAYQGYGRGKNLPELVEANRIATNGLLPDRTILLDLPVAAGLARAALRNNENGTVISEGRFDAESVNFHSRVRNGYLALAAASPERISVIDAAQTTESVFECCKTALGFK